MTTHNQKIKDLKNQRITEKKDEFHRIREKEIEISQYQWTDLMEENRKEITKSSYIFAIIAAILGLGYKDLSEFPQCVRILVIVCLLITIVCILYVMLSKNVQGHLHCSIKVGDYDENHPLKDYYTRKNQELFNAKKNILVILRNRTLANKVAIFTIGLAFIIIISTLLF